MLEFEVTTIVIMRLNGRCTRTVFKNSVFAPTETKAINDTLDVYHAAALRMDKSATVFIEDCEVVV